MWETPIGDIQGDSRSLEYSSCGSVTKNGPSLNTKTFCGGGRHSN